MQYCKSFVFAMLYVALCRTSSFLVFILLLAVATPAMAAVPDTSGSLSMMPIAKMRAEFNKRGEDVCRKMSGEARPYIDAICSVLDSTAIYDAQAKARIDKLESRMAQASSPQQKYELWTMLFDEYARLSLKPALDAAQQCEAAALQAGNYSLVAQAILYKVEIYTNCGFFREASEALATIDEERCTQPVRINYLVAAFNLEFENGFYFPRRMSTPNVYYQRMQAYYLQACKLLPKDSWILDDMNVKLNFHLTKYAEAVKWSKRLLKKLSPTSEYYPNALGNLGYNYMGMRDYAHAAKYISLSGIEEIRRGSKEYAAARKIAEVAYITGDVTRSYMLINVAMHNAEVFHSRYRYSEIASSYPKIDRDMYAYTQKQRTRLLVGFGALAVVVLLLCGAILKVVRQSRKLHRQKSLIEHQVESLSDKSRQIEDINARLLEAGHIKEAVLGQLIVASANHQSAIEKLRKEVLRRLTIKDYDGLRAVFDQQRGEAFDTLYSLDNMLLMLYPDFPEKFNSLLHEENRVTPRSDERFTTEMRIFALIRLGITKNDDLARSLNYSVNTIKSYKTRVLNASPYEKEEFYRRLMA